MALDTALPSLQLLRVEDANTVVLGGQHFQAPQLSSLSLYVDCQLFVNWSQLGSLRELEARVSGSGAVLGAAELSALTNLTALSLGWSVRQGAYDAALVLLQAVPPSLRSLTLDAWPDDRMPPPALDRFMQLTSLECGTLAIVPQLSPLRQLQALHFTSHSAGSLSVLDLAMLSELSSLRKLRFFWHQAELGVRARCLEVG